MVKLKRDIQIGHTLTVTQQILIGDLQPVTSYYVIRNTLGIFSISVHFLIGRASQFFVILFFICFFFFLVGVEGLGLLVFVLS